MEILGIGPGEFFLILVVLLMVVGPERLPGLARQIGQFLVRARNWLQTSPDAALVMRARAEIEAELASIKASLMEVQVVRDEVLGAARQLEDSVGSIAPPRLDLNSLVNPPAEPTIATNGQAVAASDPSTLVLPDGTPADGTPLDQISTLELPDGSSVPIPAADPQPITGLNGHAQPAAATAPPALAELESINIRLQAIMADMWALQQQLKQRGALDEAWQPPSVDVHLPAPEGAAEAPPPAAPEEDPAVLAARKRLEELAPMQVSFHAPPVIVEVPLDGAAEAVVPPEAESAGEPAALPILIDPLASSEPPARPRRRRAAPSAETSQTIGEAPANGVPAPKARKRRGAASPERADETEPVTTEKAS